VSRLEIFGDDAVQYDVLSVVMDGGNRTDMHY
jgi:hypothetical protein